MDFINLKYYDQLTTTAQESARINILANIKQAHTKDIDEARAAFLENPNKAINSPIHIMRVINGGQAFYKARSLGNEYLINFIRSNRVIFTPCGSYVFYVRDFGMVVNGEHYTPTPAEQKALRQPYIDINQAG